MPGGIHDNAEAIRQPISRMVSLDYPTRLTVAQMTRHPEANMSSFGRAHTVLLALVCLAMASPYAAPAAAQTSASVARQLGATMSPSQPEEFTVGTSITCTLVDPAKLAALGVEGMHAGARVTAARTAGERVHVEVDELDPAPLTKRLTLKIDPQGRLTRITQ